ncbi:RNA polymerase sigma factor [Actinomycetospora termitidis]|uniref:RNA polymerase sigma factor n=1 Tax=Actinomycetospora termitidis TaxID=3053470 RepID=A0ABT7ME54_9PSEU|nr:RNA polymerase sigma factor [Actinomycetospora sp. Odt1-22]MDL5158949.1 RNA polymerase sigma factor [Actinomycetospora sp. Odt1-22]
MSFTVATRVGKSGARTVVRFEGVLVGDGADRERDDDLALAKRAADGDAAAFADLMGRHRSRLYAVCRRITCHDEDAHEALQNTMITVWSKLRDFQGTSAVGTWLYRVATNAAIDEVRRRGRAPQPVETLPEARPRDGADHAAIARVDVDRALARIPPQFRVVVVLYEIAGLSYAQIAELRDLPIDTVKSQLSRGRKALVALLTEAGAHAA